MEDGEDERDHGLARADPPDEVGAFVAVEHRLQHLDAVDLSRPGRRDARVDVLGDPRCVPLQILERHPKVVRAKYCSDERDRGVGWRHGAEAWRGLHRFRRRQPLGHELDVWVHADGREDAARDGVVEGLGELDVGLSAAEVGVGVAGGGPAVAVVDGGAEEGADVAEHLLDVLLVEGEALAVVLGPGAPRLLGEAVGGAGGDRLELGVVGVEAVADALGSFDGGGGVGHEEARGRGVGEACGAAAAEDGVGLVLGETARRADVGVRAVARARQLGRHDPRRDGDDGVAHDHDERGDELAEVRPRRDVAVADRRERDDRPVDRARDVVEPVLPALDDVHQRAEDDVERDDGEEEDGDLAAARPERLPQHVRLGEVLDELEDAEDAEEAQHPDHREELRPRDEHAEVRREDRQQVDHAEEAPGVAARATDAEHPEDVLHREERGERPLGHAKLRAVLLPDRHDALEHHDEDGEPDDDDESEVEVSACWRVVLEDDLVEPRLPTRPRVRLELRRERLGGEGAVGIHAARWGEEGREDSGAPHRTRVPVVPDPDSAAATFRRGFTVRRSVGLDTDRRARYLARPPTRSLGAVAQLVRASDS